MTCFSEDLKHILGDQPVSILTSTSGQRAIASSVADAVVEYLLEYERKTNAATDSGTTR